jgi:1-acyl-sn-glycerol-3-phosphate acyltransferase
VSPEPTIANHPSRTLLRRALTVPLLLLVTVLLTGLLPVLLPLAWAVARFSQWRGAARSLLFVLAYLWCETIGIVSAGWIRLRHWRREPFLEANYRLQGWWTRALKVAAERLFRLRFEIEGRAALRGTPALVMPRHASIADTIIPMVFYAIPQGVRLRYVLKQELLFDPCLDIVGNRLPNYFVDRGGQDSDRARRGVARLLSGLGDREGVLIYPEGTRFSAAKRAALQARYAASPEMVAQLERWPRVLPPRLGGILALLEANPGRDLLFCAHAGFEGSSRFRDLVNGAWIGAHIRIRFWRVRFDRIPREHQQQVRFVFAQWDRMDQAVGELSGELVLGSPASQAARLSRTEA